MQKQTCKPLGFQKHPCPIPRPHLHQTHLPFLGLASGFLVNVKNVCQGLSHGPLGDLWPSCVSPHPGLTHTITMSEAFDCAKCSESLYGRKYIQTDSGPYCVPCYDNTFANTCAECQQLIGHDSRVRTKRGGGWWERAEGESLPTPGPQRQHPCLLCLTQELFYEDRHFHEGCFRCCRCQRSLADEPFTCQDSELLCNDCYCSAFSSQCSACGETVMPGASPTTPPV